MALLDNRVLDRVDRPIFRSGDDLQQEVLRRARYLDQQDQVLIELVLRGSASRREMARLVGAPAGTISRRIARIARRLHDPLIVALTDDRCPLPPEYRQLGLEHFLRRTPVREVADHHQMSPHVVREMLTYIRGWHKGITQRR